MKKKRRGTKPTPTVKQQKAITGFIAVVRGDSNASVTQVLRDAGYSPSTAEGWGNIMRSLRPHLQPHLDWLEMHRARIMARMDETVSTAGYADLTRGLKAVNEAHQLLGGKPTHRIALSPEDRSRIEEMLDEPMDETIEGENRPTA